MEMDMEDMFWEIPKQEVAKALKWAIRLVKKGKKEQWFCLHKRGMKKLDRLGKGASNDFLNMSDDQVLRYVLFDIHEDTLFTFGNLILSQG
jgi:hypothetical protein